MEGGLRNVGLVGTYPPTKCGIATFTASLATAIAAARPDCRVGIVACVGEHAPAPNASEVVAQLVSGSSVSRTDAARALGTFDVVILQHEFGIYGGEDGSEALDLVRDLDVPLIAVLHTLPRRPTPRQRAIVEELAVVCDRVVIQSAAARVRLLAQYELDADKVRLIPHGAHVNVSRQARRGVRSRVVLTWGLLGRGKGIEEGIRAIARLGDMRPPPRYMVVGQTHPRVREIHGEEYRDSLRALAADLGVADRVEFDDAYHDTRSLLQRVADADVVLLPYRSREQVVSGVLVDAIASGKPVVATRFPHAEELLAEGSGLLVPHEDPEAMAAALRSLLTDAALARRAATTARRQAHSLSWERVGESYLALAAEVIRRPALMRTLSFPASTVRASTAAQ